MLLALASSVVCISCEAHTDPLIGYARISGDGHTAVFNTSLYYDDVYAMDLDTLALECLSCDLPYSYSPSVSSDGRFVVFTGTPGATYLVDRQRGVRERLPIPGGYDATLISGDGRSIAHSTLDGHLWIRDRRSGSETLVAEGYLRTISENSRFVGYVRLGHGYYTDRETGIEEEIGPNVSRISNDGRYALLDLDPTYNCLTMVYDHTLGTTDCYSITTPDMSADGRFVTGALSYHFPGSFGVWDRQLGTFVRSPYGGIMSISDDGSRALIQIGAALYFWIR